MSSLGTWPAWLKPSGFHLTLQTNQRVNASPEGGSEQVIDRLNDRLICSVTVPPGWHASAARIEAFLASFRGQVNTINLWHFVRPQPRGTMRGTPTLAGAVAQGAAVLSIQAMAGDTLLAGDMVGVGGLLLMVQDDAVADGTGLMSLSIVNRVRVAQLSGAAVTWDKPTAPFRMLSHSGVDYIPSSVNEVTMQLGEAIGS